MKKTLLLCTFLLSMQVNAGGTDWPFKILSVETNAKNGVAVIKMQPLNEGVPFECKEATLKANYNW